MLRTADQTLFIDGVSPLRDDRAYLVPDFLVERDLPGRHGHEDVLVQAIRTLLGHVSLVTANQDRRECLADAIESAVADHFAVFVVHVMVGEEPERRAEAMSVHELDDRDQFLQPVLERRPGRYDRVRRRDALHAPRGSRVPVLDALRLVQNDQIRGPRGDEVENSVDRIGVRDDEEGGRRSVLRLAPRQAQRRGSPRDTIRTCGGW
jgi:hypothetical protein